MSNIYRQTESQRQKQITRKRDDFKKMLNKAKRDHHDRMRHLRGKWTRAKKNKKKTPGLKKKTL